MKNYLLFTFMAFTFFSCEKQSVNLGDAALFFPPAHQLHAGIAFKFYEHNIPTNKNETFSTNITYRTYQFSQPNILVSNVYDAAMRIQWNTVFQLEDNKFNILEKNYSNLTDTMEAQIIENVSLDWRDKNAVSFFKISLKNDYQMIFSNKQTGIIDTIMDNRPCKMIKGKSDYIVVSPTNDSTTYARTYEDIYAKELGLYKRFYHLEDRTFYSELVEQMSLKEFNRRANHGKKRMAYIDPAHTIDDHSNFELCNEEIRIGDYYNCDNRGQLIGGKGAWWRILKKDLKPEKLKNESGYLTFRFVLNCKGEVGRFMTEESDLDFNKKQFDKETVTHFYNIVYQQKNWQACTGDKISQDAYTYITFKLKDGKVIEILP